MYGLVNKAIEDLITREHGEQAWQQIAERAGLESPGFLSMDQYPDRVTYGLVGSASEVLEVEAERLLEAFGEFWVLYTAQEGYGELLDLSGRNFEEFLMNLDNLHTRVGLNFPDLRPPSLRCEKTGPTTFDLHYRSEREGLAPMVIGLLRGLATRFEVELDVRHRRPGERADDHDVFEIEVLVH
jgi:hypothetical protein